jgi:hypothetical protein
MQELKGKIGKKGFSHSPATDSSSVFYSAFLYVLFFLRLALF